MFPTDEQIKTGKYPKTDKNTAFDREILRSMGLPEDYAPTEEEAYRLTVSWMED